MAELSNRNARNDKEKSPAALQPPNKKWAFIITFCIMEVIWIIFSGKFDAFHMSLGVISCLLVAYLSSDLLLTGNNLKGLPGLWLRFVAYMPWLIYQIMLANFHLLYLAFHPRMMTLIDPHIIKFKSAMTDQMGLVTFANSITLTPGTITVYLSVDGNYSVHAIDKFSADPLPGDMERKVARIFEEK